MTFRAFLVVLILPAFAVAGELKAIDWGDLAPKKATIKNPFEKITPRDHADFVTVARVYDLQKAGKKPTAKQVQDAEKSRVALKKRKMDVDKLLAERDRIIQARVTQDTAVTKSLDGVSIKMSGYFLPLEFDGEKVTEFLLVPWVGACIHTPPPAPNQIVYVKGGPPMVPNDKFDPVTVEGKLAVKSVVKELFLVDGTDLIDVGYTLQATKVVRYQL